MIFDGANEIEMLYDGPNEVQAVYDGAQEIWTNFKVIDLGTNTSWDIKTLYPNLYNRLTADNFFILAANNVTGYASVRISPTDEREWSGFDGGISKSYNASTGELSIYMYCNGRTSSVHAVMVPKTDKLILLSSTDISGYDKYTQFTTDNFLIASAGTFHSGMYFYPDVATYSDSGSGTISLIKSYNSNTGALSTYLKLTTQDTSNVYTWYDRFGGTTSVTVYLNPKV